MGVLAPVVTERVEDAVAGFGLKLPVAPRGKPLTLSVTGPVKPPVGLVVTVYLVDRPWVAVRLAGDAAIVKSVCRAATNRSRTFAVVRWMRASGSKLIHPTSLSNAKLQFSVPVANTHAPLGAW